LATLAAGRAQGGSVDLAPWFCRRKNILPRIRRKPAPDAIPSNRSGSSALPSPVRDLAELLADIAFQQIRRTQQDQSKKEVKL